MQLVRPAPEHLASYVTALRTPWSPDTTRPQAAQEQLQRIEADAAAFLSAMEDREAKGAPVKLADGSVVPRLPGFVRWMWDGEFAGSINMRWQHGTSELPPWCLGHIGYAVVPWKQRRGYATAALRAMLQEARAIGLPRVIITTDPDNFASQRVIEAAGAPKPEKFVKPPQLGGSPGLRYRIHLSP